MSINKNKQEFDFFIVFIIFFAVLSYGRIYFLHDVFWDDNYCLRSVYASKNLEEFLNTGFVELRRISAGTILYYFFKIHKATDYVYIIWQSINILIQVVTPIFLYLFLKNLLKDKKTFAFFTAISFSVFPLDYSFPFFGAIVYRASLLAIIFSFYIMEKALTMNRPHFGYYLMAFLVSGFSHYFLMEGTVFFEPARLFVIGYIFYKKDFFGKDLVKKTLTYWFPFLFICIPLIAYKLMFKPYGIYSGTYETDIFFFLKWREHLKIIKVFLFQQWKILLKYINDVEIWSILFGIFATIVGFLSLKKISSKIRAEVANGNVLERLPFRTRLKNKCRSVQTIFILGIFFLIPHVILIEFVGHEISFGRDGYHFALMQIGYAIILGCLIYAFYTAFLNSYARVKLLSFSLALIVGLGIFFNNLNLDLYFNASQRQSRFWKSFVVRFPSLPENATFMMDVRDFYYFDSADMDNSYDLELAMNLLYADSTNPEKFRRYKVFAIEEFKPGMVEKFRCDQSGEEKMERMTHFGKEELDPCKFIVVHYRNGELLVNREIKEKYPDVPYKVWLNKDFPELPESAPYPLRHKFKGLDNA
ncbi:MAG: hypothetical protein FD156_1784 [Nitrospirae bacterium]|nr:MAG: hypothetical protein FD156_1784 [Nitrospirota bacterium]